MFSQLRAATLAAGAAGLLAGLALAADTSAAVFPFLALPGSDPDAAATGEQQFEMQLFSGPPGEIHLLISNDGPIFSSIAQIYVDDSKLTLFDSADVSNGPGVSILLNGGVGPDDLPGGGDIGFVTTWLFRAEAPPAHFGVNPSEWTMLIMGLSPGWDVGDVEQALISGDMRVGIHGTSFDFPENPSAAFVSVPEPSLAAAAMASLALLMRRRRG